ncbi:hypothetical protein KXD40_002141 [Peronospora effusa]|uniref:Uncharacterized protein n=1 Tax=Peronospora effusa TaxID=542832 RepID=A0A3M6VKM2_9STRA|nr:hypothetical protein DD238_005677 [Peronospora effusa]UIZ26323.1 hypothetical protein KXD40_002141 [Peronospora effusa]
MQCVLLKPETFNADYQHDRVAQERSDRARAAEGIRKNADQTTKRGKIVFAPAIMHEGGITNAVPGKT